MTRLQFHHLKKLCEEHGYTSEWVSDPKPHLTEQGDKILCKTENIVPLVVPGLSSNPGTSSSSTSLQQNSSSRSSSPASERSRSGTRKLARFTKKTKTKRDDNRVSEDRLRDLLDWLEEFTEKSGRYRSPCTPHTFLRTQIRNVLQKWHPGSTVFFLLTSQKIEVAKSACEPKMASALCRRRTGEAVPRAEKFGDLVAADHKVLNEEGESRNSHRYAVVVQDLATQWIRFYLCKNKNFSGDGKEFNKVFRAVTQTTHLKFGESCEDLPEKTNFDTSSIRDEWYCCKSSTQKKSRDVCCTVAIRFG